MGWPGRGISHSNVPLVRSVANTCQFLICFGWVLSLHSMIVAFAASKPAHTP